MAHSVPEEAVPGVGVLAASDAEMSQKAVPEMVLAWPAGARSATRQASRLGMDLDRILCIEGLQVGRGAARRLFLPWAALARADESGMRGGTEG